MLESQPVVLLVEDNDPLRDALKRMLADEGFSVADAGTAEQGLVEFERHGTIVLAVLDMMLPGKSGLDLAVELERRRPGVPILYISGLSDSIAMESIARRNPDLVLFKPFGEQEFVERVRKLISSAGMRSGPGRSTTVTAIPPSVFPWERLVEASDRLDGSGDRLISYRDTAAGFSMAVTHVAVLRAAGVAYAFRFSGSAPFPVALWVSHDDSRPALSWIERIGLGADVAPAA